MYIAKNCSHVQRVLYIELAPDDVVNALFRLAADRRSPVRESSLSETVQGLPLAGGGDFYVWNNGKLIMVEVDKIMYLEACRCYCEIHIADGKKLVPSLPLSKVAEFLPEDRFIRVHRSFVVNRKALKEIYGNIINLPNGEQLPIGREYRKALLSGVHVINTQNKKYFP